MSETTNQINVHHDLSTFTKPRSQRWPLSRWPWSTTASHGIFQPLTCWFNSLLVQKAAEIVDLFSVCCWLVDFLTSGNSWAKKSTRSHPSAHNLVLMLSWTQRRSAELFQLTPGHGSTHPQSVSNSLLQLFIRIQKLVRQTSPQSSTPTQPWCHHLCQILPDRIFSYLLLILCRCFICSIVQEHIFFHLCLGTIPNHHPRPRASQHQIATEHRLRIVPQADARGAAVADHAVLNGATTTASDHQALAAFQETSAFKALEKIMAWFDWNDRRDGSIDGAAYLKPP